MVHTLRMIQTPRLCLLPASPAMLRAALESHAALGAALAAEVPPSWPPEFVDEQVFRWMLNLLEALPEASPWWMYFVLLPQPERLPLLIGTAGYKGPPDDDGMVEVGYSIVPDHQRRGYASEATRSLIDFAFHDPRVTRVTAETLADGVASQGVLRVCRFEGPEPGSEPGLVRFTLRRDAAR